MLSKPRIRGYLTIFPLAGHNFGVQGGSGELWRLQLNERTYQLLSTVLPYLNGECNTAYILEELRRKGFESQAVQKLLEQLQKALIIEDAEQPDLLPEDAALFENQLLFFSRFSDHKSPGAFHADLRTARIDVLESEALSTEILIQMRNSGIGQLRLLGTDRAAQKQAITTVQADNPGSTTIEALPLTLPGVYAEDVAPPSLLVAPMQRWNPRVLESINQWAIKTRTPWLLIQASSISEGVVGPLFVPGQTACYMCLESRLRSNMRFHDEYEQLRDHLKEEQTASQPCGSLNAFANVLAGFATVEVIKYLTAFATPKLGGAFLSINWFNLNMEVHEVLRLPRCAFCRPPQVELFPWKEAPLELETEQL